MKKSYIITKNGAYGSSIVEGLRDRYDDYEKAKEIVDTLNYGYGSNPKGYCKWRVEETVVISD